ncbi:hypothetical protein [Streptomyces malaysiensis]|uniref:Uncharacterized protein n=1 Tax=Streptomyces malaysiensis TaxID=92644 RepID=A0A7X5X944_STRMQ|nr:hypothetical protein [Streptomyces malaysiensis]NIY68110.1 hypothetical protein [Streptomyces malaysiensis]
MAIIQQGCLRCPGCGEYVIEAEPDEYPDGVDYETPGAAESRTNCLPCRVHSGEGPEGPEDCGCSDCDAVLAERAREGWADGQTLTLLGERTEQECKSRLKISIWRLDVERGTERCTFTLKEQVPIEDDRADGDGTPRVEVYRSSTLDPALHLATCVSLDRACLYAARFLQTGHITWEKLTEDEQDGWTEVIAALLVSQDETGRAPHTSSGTRTFIVGLAGRDSSWDATYVTDGPWLDTAIQVVHQFLLERGDVDPLDLIVRDFNRGEPMRLWTDLRTSA